MSHLRFFVDFYLHLLINVLTSTFMPNTLKIKCPKCSKNHRTVRHGKYRSAHRRFDIRAKCKNCNITFLVKTNTAEGHSSRPPNNKKGNIFDIPKESLEAMHKYIVRGTMDDELKEGFYRHTLPKRPFNLYDTNYQKTKNGGHSVRTIIKEMLCNKEFMESLEYKSMLKDHLFWFNIFKYHKRFIVNVIKVKVAKKTLEKIMKNIPISDWRKLEDLYKGKGEELRLKRNKHLRALRAIFGTSKDIKPDLNYLQPINLRPSVPRKYRYKEKLTRRFQKMT